MLAERRTTPNLKSPFGACRAHCVKCTANKRPMPLTRRAAVAGRRCGARQRRMGFLERLTPLRRRAILRRIRKAASPRARLYAALALCLSSAAPVGRGRAVLKQTRERFVEWGAGRRPSSGGRTRLAPPRERRFPTPLRQRIVATDIGRPAGEGDADDDRIPVPQAFADSGDAQAAHGSVAHLSEGKIDRDQSKIIRHSRYFACQRARVAIPVCSPMSCGGLGSCGRRPRH